MNFLNPQLKFDETKIFYPLICCYLAQVHGFIELQTRGAISALETFTDFQMEAYLSPQNLTHKEKILKISKNRHKTELLAQVELHSTVDNSIRLDSDTLAKDLYDKSMSPNAAITYFNRMSAGSLLIVAWEITKANHVQDERWEFLRHCRNAAAHKGHFNLLNGEPKRPAKWRSLEIQASLNGQPLFPDPPTLGFIEIGDVLHLLSDIEAKFL